MRPSQLTRPEEWEHPDNLLNYRGIFDDATVAGLGQELRDALPAEIDENTRLLIFGTLVELCQNVQRYSAERAAPAEHGIGGVLARRVGASVVVASLNRITREQAAGLRPQLELLSTRTAEELKTLRRERRRQGPPEGSRGAGLGLIEAARRADAPLKFAILAREPQHSDLVLLTQFGNTMSPMNIAATEVTPAVIYDESRQVLRIEGESYPENVSAFFEPVFAWLEEFLRARPAFAVELRILYLNTSSTKALLDLLLMLEDFHRAGGEVQVRWHYRPGIEVMQEAGEEIAEDLELPFTLVADDAM